MHSEQQGFTLITAIVFLMILSIMGLNTMQKTQVEQQKTINVQDQNHAFQLTESALARTLHKTAQETTTILDPGVGVGKQTVGNEPGALQPPFNYRPEFTNPIYPDGKPTTLARATVRYLGEGTLKGQSLSQIQSIGTATLHVFQIEATVRYNGSTSVHQQGISIVGPKLQ